MKPKLNLDTIGYIKGTDKPILLVSLGDEKFFMYLRKWESQKLELERTQTVEHVEPEQPENFVPKLKYDEMVLEYERKLHHLKQDHEHEVFKLQQEAINEGLKRIESVENDTSPPPSEVSDVGEPVDLFKIPVPIEESDKEIKKKKIEKVIAKKNSLPKTSVKRDLKKWM